MSLSTAKSVKVISTTLLLIGIIITDIQAQTMTGTGGPDLGFTRGSFRARNRNQSNGAVIYYSPYCYKEAREASIIMLSGDTLSGLYLYNMETETLENIESSKTIPWNYVRSFSFAANAELPEVAFSNMYLVWPESEYGGFIQDVKSSPFVKVKHLLKYVPADYSPTMDAGNTKDRILKYEIKYLKIRNQWVELPTLKTSFYEMFGGKSEALRKQARKNRWKYKNPEDIGKMISWLSTVKN